MKIETKYLLSKIEACLACAIPNGPEVRISKAVAKELINEIKIVKKLNESPRKGNREPYYFSRLENRIFVS